MAWLVFDRRGEVIGNLQVPRGTTIVQAAPDHIWAIEEDELGVSYVVRFQVMK